ncbi:WG repeat-containing protein [Bacteroides cellulosilyticus]|uniref:WG repeat-containing protein n=1 Tax=Bacteroides cellulosilyticus TaxID=246787 RepID=UPI0034A3D2F0
MANFKITATTTVAELKEQFHNEFGGILRIYQGRSEAPEDATLVSLGGKVGELECRASRTVGKFIEAFQSELGLKVKVYTKDNWVSVLDGITLATVREIPKNARKAQMKQYLAYQRDENEDISGEDINLTSQEGENEKYGFIDKSGKFVIEPQFEFADDFSEGLAIVTINDEYGFIDKSGKFVIEPQFEYASKFSDGISRVENNGKEFKIDTNGNVVSDLDSYEDFTESKLEDIKSRGGIVVAMSKCNAKDAADLRYEVGNGDVVSVITFVDDAFHYLGDEYSSIEDFEEKNIDFDNLYLIYDENGELDELNHDGRVYSGSYLSEDEWSHYQSDNYPSDDNALCYVMTEALTGDDTGHVNGAYFDAPKVFICEGKIIAECD